MNLADFGARWFGHPDPDVDLAIFLMGNLLQVLEERGTKVFLRMLGNETLPSQALLESLTPMEDIVMIGYPNGIWDAINNIPILRRGITATPVSLDYEGRREFMIDAACFPGSSGSPVLLLNQGTYSTKNGDLVMGNRIALLGVLYAGPQHTATGEIVIANVPTGNRPVPISRIPNNLGLCIKVSRILEFEAALRAQGFVLPAPSVNGAIAS